MKNIWNEENKNNMVNKRDKFSGILRDWSQNLFQWLITVNDSRDVFLHVFGVGVAK